jgi:glucose/arabinose dehydrogenase/lysophospholipase L1-like esterase
MLRVLLCLTVYLSSNLCASPLAAEDRVAGLLANVYELNRPITSCNQAPTDAEPTRQQADLQIDLPTVAALQQWASGGAVEQVFVRWFGKIDIKQAGKHTFYVTSDDGSRLLIDGAVVVDNDGLHGMAEASGEVELTKGAHDIVVEYFNNTGGAGCVVAWKAGKKKQVLPSSVLSFEKSDAPKLPEPGKLAKFEISPGQHISIIGGTLAERMQHDGWLEALLQSRFPKHELVMRNLGFSGDALDSRLRVEGFGSQDDWLRRTKSGVVFAFFGFSESFAGEEGIDDFKSRLTRLIQGMSNQRYNGQEPPALVLFSPIAHEDLKDRNLPNGSENNQRLKQYTTAMSEVAAEHGVTFVDLFTPTLAAYGEAKEPLTINGVHLNRAGNRVVAEAIDQSLFDNPAPARDEAQLEKLCAAAADKNFYYFSRYQPTDGYNVHGGRSKKVYNGISNVEVMNREMEMLETYAANRDKRIWALAQGSDLVVDDSNLPEPIPVTTNIKGPGPNGEHEFLSGEAAIEQMKVAEGMKVSLFASEEQFPELVNPVQMAFDTAGRLFVCAWPTYPHWNPREEMNDKLLILIDKDGDGKADECKTFADKLHNPTGFEFWGGGVLVAMAPDILFLKDTDGDDVADVRMRVLHGISSGDTHHTANSFVLDPGGALYFQEGVFHRSQIETPYGTVRNVDGCVWRYEPRTGKVNRHVPHGFANPHGHVYDRWGQGFVHDGTGAVPYHETVFSGHLDQPGRRGGAPVLYNRRTRPCPATEILSSRHFPAENQGNLLVLNVIGFQGILQYKFSDKDSSFTATEIEPILSGGGRNFRPVDAEIGPDGSLYFTDWQNPIIGHLQHHIRDPNRDKTHGRVYRVTYPGRPLLTPPKVAGEPIEELLDLLEEPEDRLRYRVRIELSGRDSDAVVAAVQKWAAALDKSDPDYEHHMLEALWVHQQHNVVNEELLKRTLRSPDYRARAAATRVLGYWGDRVNKPLVLLMAQVQDDHPRVRLEAVRAASFFRTSKATEAALTALLKPMDNYLKYTLDQTINQLKQFGQ